MAKLVNIYIDGNFDDGFSVRAEIRENNNRSPVSSERAIASDRGRLPAAPHLRGKISSWYKMYAMCNLLTEKSFKLQRIMTTTI